jgi:hypothetical protein
MKVRIFSMTTAIMTLMIGMSHSVSAQSWTVTKPIVNQAYSISQIDIDASVSWMQGMTAVSGIDVEVWVNGINRTGAGGSLNYPAHGTYDFKVTGSITCNTQFNMSMATVKFFAKNATGRIPGASYSTSVNIMLSP